MAPLSGVTVLDLTHVLAGPFCSHTLQDLGARVIKVERPGLGDDTRAFPPFVNDTSAYFAALNSGKQSIALDLKSEEGREALQRLFEDVARDQDLLRHRKLPAFNGLARSPPRPAPTR